LLFIYRRKLHQEHQKVQEKGYIYVINADK